MFKVGDAIKWMCPLDNDYTYGEIMDRLQLTGQIF